MYGDGLGKLGSILEMSHAYETDLRLREQLEEKWDREAAIEQLQISTQLTEQDVLNELVDCGLRAESLHVLTLVPMVSVAWANGFVERGERQAILEAAQENGMKPTSKAFELLTGWLKERPNPTLLKTWKDYVAAIRRIVSRESYAALRAATVFQAITVAEASGGCLGYGAVSKAEQAVIDDLRSAFDE